MSNSTKTNIGTEKLSAANRRNIAGIIYSAILNQRSLKLLLAGMLVLFGGVGNNVFAAKNSVSAGTAPTGITTFCLGANASGNYTVTVTECGGVTAQTVNYEWRIDGVNIGASLNSFTNTGGVGSEAVVIEPLPAANLAALGVGTHTIAVFFRMPLQDAAQLGPLSPPVQQ